MIVSTITQYVGIVCGAIWDPDAIPVESIWIFFILNGLNTFNYIYFLIMCEMWTAMHSGQSTYLLAAGPGGQPTSAWNGNSTYMTGGPIGGGAQPSADDVRRDLRNRPPPGGQKAAKAFNNPKAKAKTLAELAAE